MMASSVHLKNIFTLTPPEYLRMPSVGINISDNSIKLMDIQQTSHGLRPTLFASRSMPEGAMRSGVCEDPEAVAQVLRKLKHEYDIDLISASIPEENGYVFGLTVPAVSDSEIHDAISYQLSEHVPLSPHEVVFGHRVTAVNPRTEARSVSVSVLPRQIVEQYEALFQMADLIPVRFEIESEAIRRAVVPSNTKCAVMTVDIGRSRTGIAIVDAGAVRYTSTLQLGGDQLTAAVAQALSVSLEEAEDIKQTEGFIKNRKKEKLYRALSESVTDLTNEMSRRFRFWNTHQEGVGHQREKITEIILIGGNASIPGLAQHVTETTGVNASVGNVWANVCSFDEYVPEIDFRHSLTYTAAIGLALPSD